jgi:hypothetical protein
MSYHKNYHNEEWYALRQQYSAALDSISMEYYGGEDTHSLDTTFTRVFSLSYRTGKPLLELATLSDKELKRRNFGARSIWLLREIAKRTKGPLWFWE